MSSCKTDNSFFFFAFKGLESEVPTVDVTSIDLVPSTPDTISNPHIDPKEPKAMEC